MPPKTADDKDYESVQGGRPKKSVDGDLTTYTHDYPGGEGMKVPSHINHGTVILKTPEGDREFNVDEFEKIPWRSV